MVYSNLNIKMQSKFIKSTEGIFVDSNLISITFGKYFCRHSSIKMHHFASGSFDGEQRTADGMNRKLDGSIIYGKNIYCNVAKLA